MKNPITINPTAPVEASGSERVVPVCHEIPLSNHMKVTLEYDPDGSRTATLWSEANEPIADGDAPDLAALRPQPSGETRARIMKEVLDAVFSGFEHGECEKDWEPEYGKEIASLATDAILALLSARPLALGGQQGDSETLRVLLDNLVIAQTLSKDIRQKATDEACSYLYDRRTTPARAETQDEGAAGEPEWVVNDIAELGVKIGERFYWLYKGQSLVYGKPGDDVKDGVVQHDDDGGNMHWRPVFKREFGECCHPVNYADPTRIGTVSLDDSDDWKPLPAAHPSPTPDADADRVREALKLSVDALFDLKAAFVKPGTYDGAKGKAIKQAHVAHRSALAALKSEGK